MRPSTGDLTVLNEVIRNAAALSPPGGRAQSGADLAEVVWQIHQAGTTIPELERLLADHSATDLLIHARIAHGAEEASAVTLEQASRQANTPIEHLRYWVEDRSITAVKMVDGSDRVPAETVDSLMTRPADRPPLSAALNDPPADASH